MIVKKITVGFVIQDYDTETKKFVSQEFIAGDQVDWEDEDGNAIPEEDAYLSFEMIQPEDMESVEDEAPTVDQEVEDRRIKWVSDSLQPLRDLWDFQDTESPFSFPPL